MRLQESSKAARCSELSHREQTVTSRGVARLVLGGGGGPAEPDNSAGFGVSGPGVPHRLGLRHAAGQAHRAHGLPVRCGDAPRTVTGAGFAGFPGFLRCVPGFLLFLLESRVPQKGFWLSDFGVPLGKCSDFGVFEANVAPRKSWVPLKATEPYYQATTQTTT